RPRDVPFVERDSAMVATRTLASQSPILFMHQKSRRYNELCPRPYYVLSHFDGRASVESRSRHPFN
ncbi:MAG: hypothetical protein WCF79_16280, partial [Rhodomicrobium sp.]